MVDHEFLEVYMGDQDSTVPWVIARQSGHYPGRVLVHVQTGKLAVVLTVEEARSLAAGMLAEADRVEAASQKAGA